MFVVKLEDLKELRTLLLEEYNLYLEEYEIVEERVELIKEKKVEELSLLIEKEKKLSKIIETIENKRIAIVDKYSSNLSLKELLNTIQDQNIKDELLNLREKLLFILEKIEAKNNLASQLIDVSSKMLETLLKEAAGEKELGYDKFSQKSSVVSNNLLNTRG